MLARTKTLWKSSYPVRAFFIRRDWCGKKIILNNPRQRTGATATVSLEAEASIIPKRRKRYRSRKQDFAAECGNTGTAYDVCRGKRYKTPPQKILSRAIEISLKRYYCDMVGCYKQILIILWWRSTAGDNRWSIYTNHLYPRSGCHVRWWRYERTSKRLLILLTSYPAKRWPCGRLGGYSLNGAKRQPCDIRQLWLLRLCHITQTTP